MAAPLEQARLPAGWHSAVRGCGTAFSVSGISFNTALLFDVNPDAKGFTLNLVQARQVVHPGVQLVERARQLSGICRRNFGVLAKHKTRGVAGYCDHRSSGRRWIIDAVQGGRSAYVL